MAGVQSESAQADVRGTRRVSAVLSGGRDRGPQPDQGPVGTLHLSMLLLEYLGVGFQRAVIFLDEECWWDEQTCVLFSWRFSSFPWSRVHRVLAQVLAVERPAMGDPNHSRLPRQR